MANKFLKVYVRDDLAGHLIQLKTGNLQFKYVEAYGGQPVSISVPYRKKAYSHEEIFAFFENLIPEGEVRYLLARHYRTTEKSIFKLLSYIGKDCSGLISLYDPDEEFRKEECISLREFSAAKELFGENLDDLIFSLENNRFSSEVFERMSMAGAQAKMPVVVLKKYSKRVKKNDYRIFFKDKVPTNALIKVNSRRYENIVYNEFFCLSLAGVLGFNIPSVLLQKTENTRSFLLIARYDRKIEMVNSNEVCVYKYWQMDFCQKLNILSTNKYQNNGGPSVLDISKNLFSTDKLEFIKAVIFNFLIGNNDAHGKNFSILETSQVDMPYKLAPLYDLVCTNLYDDYPTKMAMKIGGEYECYKIRRKHFEKMARELNFKEVLILRLVDGISKNILKEAKNLKEKLISEGLESNVYDEIIAVIEKNVKQLEK
ncbi:MAG: type II toxin-antitoxin system HipA family toxin [Proteobacteria bacterium]|nr:type II toxin-antitoxin system HipA family toxin [Pseudomonadota bacterium]